MLLHNVDPVATRGVDAAVNEMVELLESHWDLADRSRRVMSAYNRKRTSQEAMPRIDLGDYVLYAVHKPDTKLDYVWRGPGVVLRKVSPMVYEVKPAGVPHAKPMEVHVCKLRRFAAASLQLTEQIRADLARDHPDNVVAKLVGHDMSDGEVWFRCRWKGFSKAVDSWQTGEVLQQDCPEVIRAYAQRLRSKGRCDDELDQYVKTAFPAGTVAKVTLPTSDVSSDSDDSDTDAVAETNVTEGTVTTTPTITRAAPTVRVSVTPPSQPAPNHRYPLRTRVRR